MRAHCRRRLPPFTRRLSDTEPNTARDLAMAFPAGARTNTKAGAHTLATTQNVTSDQ